MSSNEQTSYYEEQQSVNLNDLDEKIKSAKCALENMKQSSINPKFQEKSEAMNNPGHSRNSMGSEFMKHSTNYPASGQQSYFSTSVHTSKVQSPRNQSKQSQLQESQQYSQQQAQQQYQQLQQREREQQHQYQQLQQLEQQQIQQQKQIQQQLQQQQQYQQQQKQEQQQKHQQQQQQQQQQYRQQYQQSQQYQQEQEQQYQYFQQQPNQQQSYQQQQQHQQQQKQQHLRQNSQYEQPKQLTDEYLKDLIESLKTTNNRLRDLSRGIYESRSNRTQQKDEKRNNRQENDSSNRSASVIVQRSQVIPVNESAPISSQLGAFDFNRQMDSRNQLNGRQGAHYQGSNSFVINDQTETEQFEDKSILINNHTATYQQPNESDWHQIQSSPIQGPSQYHSKNNSSNFNRSNLRNQEHNIPKKSYNYNDFIDYSKKPDLSFIMEQKGQSTNNPIKSTIQTSTFIAK